MNNFNERIIKRRGGRLNRIFSKISAFLCAVIIFFAVLFSIGAFMHADLQSREIAGNHDYQIFSYGRTGEATAEFTAFGENFAVDLTRVRGVVNILGEISSLNKDYTPSVITLCGNIIRGCVSSVTESFMKIPDIIKDYLK
ncbi:MAG: hypothetical protein FWH10_05660 [Oscillospiraceae bacterium]|nr:hypothetical protein [Oscillospiraceae bacterium]